MRDSARGCRRIISATRLGEQWIFMPSRSLHVISLKTAEDPAKQAMAVKTKKGDNQ
jgi:hypothetical protein